MTKLSKAAMLANVSMAPFVYIETNNIINSDRARGGVRPSTERILAEVAALGVAVPANDKAV